MGWQQQAAGGWSASWRQCKSNYNFQRSKLQMLEIQRWGDGAAMTELLLVSLLISCHDSSSLAPDPEH